MKNDQFYLFHIYECILRIEKYVVEGKDHFAIDQKTQDAVLRNLQTMAESTQRLSVNIKENNPEIKWQQISGMRNILVHDYLGINVVRIWEIIDKELPILKQRIKSIMDKYGINIDNI